MFDAEQDAQRALRGIVAERTRPIVAWVGSGLSAEAQLPTWKQLKGRLVKALYDKAFRMRDSESLVRAADTIKDMDNYWLSFERLKQNLGPTTYKDLIRESLLPASDVAVPETYRLLWHLPIQGMVTLNLDRMAVRAHESERPNKRPLEFNGHQVGNLLRGLHGLHPFIVNLHGTAEDTSTWVFTRDELNILKNRPDYQTFLSNCLSSFTNLFVGLSVDDVAVGAHLQALKQSNVPTPSHFWITSRTDSRTDAWAESLSVRLIRYSARDRDHSEVLDALRDLLQAVPDEPAPAPPVVFPPVARATDALPSVEEMSAWDTERVRQALNAEASRILNAVSAESYAEYDAFVDRYDELIHRAWYTSERATRNSLLGHTLKEQVAIGAFGKVYRAEDPSGQPVAVKVLREEVRQNAALLQSFRRGVRSMRILQDNGIKGMVAYEKASEIPAFVTMEWIEGPNLLDAKRDHLISEWGDVLNIGKELTQIIRSAHALPQRVLHRDIRPANVMLRDYWTRDGSYEVVVLDFDLSWHRGAKEKSVVHTTAVGYLAPEQIGEARDGSTRAAAVDAFGIGMTLYFLCGGKEPMPELHKHGNYAELVRVATHSPSMGSWRSLPDRVARLIIGATMDKQSERWDLSQIYDELTRLQELDAGRFESASVPMIVEELASQSITFGRYEWNSDSNSALFEAPTGLSLRLESREAEGGVVLVVSWQSTGHEQRTGMAKYVARSTKGLKERIQNQGWSVVRESREQQSMYLMAVRDSSAIRSNLPEEARRLDEALSVLKFAD